MQTLAEFRQMLAEVRHTFLRGTMQDDNPISLLRGNRYVLEDIFQMVEQPQYDEYLKYHIDRVSLSFATWPREKQLGITPHIMFPSPTDLNINMMPIHLGHGLFRSLPSSCIQYAQFIWRHCLTPNWVFDDQGNMTTNIGYLTIQEGLVPVGTSHRRSGLHIERPGFIRYNGIWHPKDTQRYQEIAWGLGAWREDGLPENGIFMASTVDESCAVWPVLIDNPSDVSDKHGGIEHMRHLLGEPRKLKANELCWFTDRTPHESLPVKAPNDDPSAKYVYRQFFRLVVGPISVWYSKHNTPNPLGIQPDAMISDEDKFED